MDQENKTTAPEEELMTEETAEAVTEEKSPEEKKTKKKKSKEAEALETCEAEKKELEDRYLRLMAEYENYRRRTQKERENSGKHLEGAAAPLGQSTKSAGYPLCRRELPHRYQDDSDRL